MKRIFIIGLLFLYAFTLYSQSNIRYYFKTLDIQDGLSQNTVNAILQDKQGFMWFGTKDGLNRFDGLSFRIPSFPQLFYPLMTRQFFCDFHEKSEDFCVS